MISGPKQSRGNPPRGNCAISIAVAFAIQASVLSVASAQEAPSDKASSDNSVEQVVVTGSRIARRDYVANSPIQTVDAGLLEDKAGIGIENTLNKLPEFVPAASEYTQVRTGELINTGSTTTAGAATLSLRGLGPNRNLVLIDGMRAVPVNATMAVDLNTVPSAAIDRIETITGGASSVYGADAVAGVVNFILKKHFEGINLDAQYGAMQNGHAGETKLSALLGANSPNGKGNVMVGLEYDNREAVQWKDVDFYRKAMLDPTTNGTISIVTDPYVTFPTTNAPSGSAIDSIFNKAPPGVVFRNGSAIGGNMYLNQDGTVYTGASIFNTVSPPAAGSTAGLYRYDGPLMEGDFPFRKIDSQGFLQEYIPGHKANVPLERYSLFTRGEYNFSEYLSVHVQGSSVEDKTTQLWQVSPATGGWSSTIPHGTGIYAPSLAADGTTLLAYQKGGQFGLNCPAVGGCTNTQAFPVSPELEQLLDSRPNPNDTYNLSYSLDFPDYGIGVPRTIDTTQRTDQFLIGANGAVPFLDGSWDVTFSHGSSTLGLLKEGYASLSQWRAVIQSPNYGKGFFAQANSGPPGGGFAGGVAQCTSGIPVFSSHAAISQDCVDAVTVTLQDQSRMLQNDLEANLQGRLFNLPAGEVRFSVGTEYRKDDYRYIFDHLNTQDSFLDLGLGTFPANSTHGVTSVKELYGELSVPVVKDLPLVKHLNLELGYRYSDYRYGGRVGTYKILADWAPIDALRFRGGYQKATRAPNIAELFQAQSQTWGYDVTTDPCSFNTLTTYGVNPAVNPASATKALALCKALMGTAGAAAYYAQPVSQMPQGGGLWFVNATGNPNVKPEDATTYTGGLVFQPRSDNPLLAGFSGSIDWYLIKIEGMIAPQSGPSVYQQCFSPASNPNFDPTNPACEAIIRNPSTGGMTASNVTFINTGGAKLSGIDYTIDWKAQLSDMGLHAIPGRVGINFIVSELLKEQTQQDAATAPVDWVGSIGPPETTTLNAGAFRYRLFTTFNYGVSNIGASLRWRHLPSAKSVLQQEATAGVTITQLGAQTSYDVFDFSASYAINENFQVRFGIDNLFDTPPVITGARTAQDPQPTSGAGVTEPGFYDVLGRQLYLGVKVKF